MMAKEIETNSTLQNPWGDTGPAETLNQVADLAGKFLSAPVDRSPDRSFFDTLRDNQKTGLGIEEIYGEITTGNKLRIKARLVTLPNGIRVSDNFVLSLLETFKDFQSADPPCSKKSGKREIWFEFLGEAAPLGLTREAAFLKRLETLNDMAKRLQAQIPEVLSGLDLDKTYKDHMEYLTPVYPFNIDNINKDSTITEWASKSYDFVTGQCSVAMVSSHTVLCDFGLAVLARVYLEKGSSLGRITPTQLTTQVLLDATNKAPGTVVVPVDKLTIGSNLYNISTEVRAMFSSLDASGKAVIFTGTYQQLRTVLGGGQGGKSEPLEPVVQHIPDIPMDILVPFAVQSEGRRYGGLSRADQQKIVKNVFEVLAKDTPAMQYRLLPKLVAHALADQSRQHAGASMSLPKFRDLLKKPTENLSGLGHGPGTERAPHVQEHFLKVLDDPGLLHFLKANILGQEKALEELIKRLLDQVTGEKLYKPLFYLAQGTTGTGKSESAKRLAKALGVPLKTIDVASMGSPEMAKTKLHGSSPGFVGSYESGILEKMAKNHLGVVVEVMDLDHATPEIRSSIADEFLQILDKGEAETGTGAVFSCANLIFIFTMNLPCGRDEKVRRATGFGKKPTEKEVQREITKEVKSLFSAAFSGRVGAPILFEDLNHESLATILEKGIADTIQTAAERYGIAIGKVTLEKGLGMAMVASSGLASAKLGARSFIDLSRSKGSQAFREFRNSGATPNGKNLIVSWNAKGSLSISID